MVQPGIAPRPSAIFSRLNKQEQQHFQFFVLGVTFLSVIQSFPCLLVDNDGPTDKDEDDSPTRLAVIARTRVHVSMVFDQLGPHYTPRAYRMTQSNFFALHRLLFPYKKYRSLRTSGRDHRVRQRKGAANGLVPSSTRLAVAIRFFAGGSPYDLSGLFAISVKEVYRSVWVIVDAINNCHKLRIEFPSDHAQQQKIAMGFKANLFLALTVALEPLMEYLSGLSVQVKKTAY